MRPGTRAAIVARFFEFTYPVATSCTSACEGEISVTCPTCTSRATSTDFCRSKMAKPARSTPLPTTVDKTDAFTKNLIRYGSGEAYVEAHAAPVEAKS